MGQISDRDIGKRVTIRLHDDPESGGGFRDIVGYLLSPTTLKNRHGEIIEFNPADIYIWREIAEVPRTAKSGAPLSIRIYDLERVANKTWRAAEEEAIGNWILRADVGVTRRANSALILGSDNQIDSTINWYCNRNLQPTVSLVPAINESLDQELERRGFEKLLDLDLMVKEPSTSQVEFNYEVSQTPSDDWLAIHGDKPIAPLLARCDAKYLKIYKDNDLISIGRVAFADDWALISRIWVAPEARGKGFGRKMLSALEYESNGAKLALQVQRENKSAFSLYQSAGYQTHHSCRFRALSLQKDLTQDYQC